MWLLGWVGGLGLGSGWVMVRAGLVSSWYNSVDLGLG